MLKRSLLFCVLILFVLAGCVQATQESIEQSLELKTKMTMLEPGQLTISFGMHNPGKLKYEGNGDLEGSFTILDEAGNLQFEGKFEGPSILNAGETFFPYTYEAEFLPGVYDVQVNALGKDPLVTQFEIVEKDGALKLIAPSDYIDPFTLYTEGK